MSKPVHKYPRSALSAVVRNTIHIFGGIGILVSYAGIQTIAPLDQLELAKWKQKYLRAVVSERTADSGF